MFLRFRHRDRRIETQRLARIGAVDLFRRASSGHALRCVFWVEGGMIGGQLLRLAGLNRARRRPCRYIRSLEDSQVARVAGENVEAHLTVADRGQLAP